jgi:predicted site-specific integrase-resolvase
MSKKRLKVSTYATLKGVSTTSVYDWIAKGKIELEVIDGVKFVIVEDE